MPVSEEKKRRAGIIILFVMVTSLLVGCSMKTETAMNTHRVNLKSDIYRAELVTDRITDNVLYTISEHYRRYGDDSIELTITYDARSASNTAMHAASEAARMAQELRRLGARDIKTTIMPVKDQGEKSTTLLRYNIVTAHAPPECEAMGGMDGQPMEVNADYKFGCSIEILLARQIARPKDLAGRTEMTETDGRRQTIIIERYRAGQTNEALTGGESATEQ